jgi:hypothetical protein
MGAMDSFSFERISYGAANMPTRPATDAEVEAALRARGITTAQKPPRGKAGPDPAKVYAAYKQQRGRKTFSELWHAMGGV